MTREEVLSKIQKMLRLATNSGATENEAYVAMHAAGSKISNTVRIVFR